ncbi:hypothetical protein KI387_017798, partial [Taxus chinensis]
WRRVRAAAWLGELQGGRDRAEGGAQGRERRSRRRRVCLQAAAGGSGAAEGREERSREVEGQRLLQAESGEGAESVAGADVGGGGGGSGSCDDGEGGSPWGSSAPTAVQRGAGGGSAPPPVIFFFCYI